MHLPRLFLVLSLPLLAACGGGTVYYAQGVDVAMREADFGICTTQANTDFPVRNVIRYTPRYFVPGDRVCNSAGRCYTRGGYWRGGQPYSVDLNENARVAATRGCMGARGYARIELPACEPGSAVRLSTVMPELRGDTCLLQSGSGSPLVVNPDRP